MESASIKFTLNFHHPVKAFALVIGGWFPLCFAPNGVLLIDRNILGVLPCVSEESIGQDSEAMSWWLSFLNSGRHKLNPVLCAMEGSDRSIPTYTEFKKSFNDACTLIQKHLPLSSLVEFTEKNYRAAYQTIEDSQERYHNETGFLIEACPLLIERKSDKYLRETENALFSLCKKYGLQVFSLPLLAALSCLYENKHGHKPLIGRNVLKLSASYSAADAHNALADLHSLEHLAASNGLDMGDIALCTRDKNLAALWCSLKFERGSWHAGSVDLNIQLGGQLFPRLSEPEINDLHQRINKNRL